MLVKGDNDVWSYKLYSEIYDYTSLSIQLRHKCTIWRVWAIVWVALCLIFIQGVQTLQYILRLMIYVYMYIMKFYVITKDKVTNNITPHNTAGTFLQTACIIIWFCDNVSIFRAFLVDFYFWFYGLICLIGKNLQCCCKPYQIIKMTWKIVLTIFGASAIAVFFQKHHN